MVVVVGETAPSLYEDRLWPWTQGPARMTNDSVPSMLSISTDFTEELKATRLGCVAVRPTKDGCLPSAKFRKMLSFPMRIAREYRMTMSKVAHTVASVKNLEDERTHCAAV